MTDAQFVRRADSHMQPSAAARWCVFVDDQLLVLRDADALRLPDAASLARHGVQPNGGDLLGTIGDVAYFVGTASSGDLPLPLERIDLRQAYGQLSEQEYSVAGFGSQIAYWEQTNQFCSRCATPLQRIPTERGKRCPQCDLSNYPRVSPCIITLIYHDDQVLLTRKPEWPPNRYSLVAGFVEPGESLEACLRREVLEEVGVHVDTVQYLGSQPWPFPHQLMVGYLAHYQSGEIAIDATELEHAAWFDLDALPHLPPPLSIARKIIDWYVARQHDPSTPFPAE